jgi:hypothetical protein
MARHWQDHEKMIAGLGKSGSWGHALWYLAAIFAILGVIADAVNAPLGLEAMSWFLLAIASFLASITFFIGWAVSWYLKMTEAKK